MARTMASATQSPAASPSASTGGVSARASDPVARQKSASPSTLRCGGDSAAASPSWPSAATRRASAPSRAASVATMPIVVWV